MNESLAHYYTRKLNGAGMLEYARLTRFALLQCTLVVNDDDADTRTFFFTDDSAMKVDHKTARCEEIESDPAN